MADEIEILSQNKTLAFDLLSFMDVSSDEEEHEERVTHRNIRQFQMASNHWQLTHTRYEYINKIKESPMLLQRDWTNITDADISKIWSPTPDDARIGVHVGHEANWRTRMEPYNPGTKVAHTAENVLPLYHENIGYPNLDGIPYIKALQRHRYVAKSFVQFSQELPAAPVFRPHHVPSLPLRIPPGFERYVPFVHTLEANAAGDTMLLSENKENRVPRGGR